VASSHAHGGGGGGSIEGGGIDSAIEDMLQTQQCFLVSVQSVKHN